MAQVKASVARFEGDGPPSYHSKSEDHHEYETLPSPVPDKPPPPQRSAIVGAQPKAGNKKFSSRVEGGGSASRSPQVAARRPSKEEDKVDQLIDIELAKHSYVAVVVSGIRFVSPRDSILSHAETRLGQAVASAVVDGPRMLQMYGMDAASDIAGIDNEIGGTVILEFYCDRNPMIFPHIQQYYRTGTLHLPHNLCWNFVEDELLFWGIDQSAIPECCMNSFRTSERHLSSTRLVQTLFYAEKFDVKRLNKGFWKTGTLYKFMYEVESSLSSYLYFYLYMIFALLFAISFILQIGDAFRVGHPPTRVTNSTHCVRFVPNNPRSNLKMYFMTHPHPIFRFFDVFIIVWFSLDLILRFICYPSKVLFLCHAPNIIELICLAGNYFSLLLLEISNGHFWCSVSLLKAYLGMEILRVFRLVRIPFFSPRYSWMRVLLLTLKRGFTEFMLLVGLVFVFVMLFGYLIVIPEMSHAVNLEAGQKSISANIYQPHMGMWWSIVTMTTVGYGDLYPSSPTGYVIGSLCAVTGVLFLSLQVPLISNRFNLLYQYAKQESNKLEEIKRQKQDAQKQILESERIRREQFWQKQFEKEEYFDEAFRSGKLSQDFFSKLTDDGGEELDYAAKQVSIGGINPSAGPAPSETTFDGEPARASRGNQDRRRKPRRTDAVISTISRFRRN